VRLLSLEGRMAAAFFGLAYREHGRTGMGSDLASLSIADVQLSASFCIASQHVLRTCCACNLLLRLHTECATMWPRLADFLDKLGGSLDPAALHLRFTYYATNVQLTLAATTHITPQLSILLHQYLPLTDHQQIVAV
jgi:hypothetical protein